MIKESMKNMNKYPYRVTRYAQSTIQLLLICCCCWCISLSDITYSSSKLYNPNTVHSTWRIR